jgi:hypothetical protein
MNTVPQEWKDAVQEFVYRVDQGEIRSKATYAKFKALLEADATRIASDDDYMHLLFNMGMVMGALTKPEFVTRLIESMCDGNDGARLSGHVGALYTKLGHIIDAANIKRFDPKDEVKNEPA